MIHQISCRIPNNRIGNVGWWNDEELPRTYHSVRNNLKGEIFQAPQFHSAVGLNDDIIKQLLKYNITDIEFQIIGFEKESFFIRIKLNDFILKGKKINYGFGKQRILPMEKFLRIYPEQTQLISNVKTK